MSARDAMAALDALLARVGADRTTLTEMRGRLEAALAAAAAAATAAAGEAAACGAAQPTPSFHGLIGESPAMQQLYRLIEKFGRANASVLITGESGTGKECVAKALHAVSARVEQAFVAENCAAIPETLLESVLFGHKKGAFTGAISDHPGHFLSAHKGTIFLDEIGEMAMPMQVKLLRVLQESEVRPVGGTKVRKIDIRIVAATNQNLEQRVRDGGFREDLYFRLNVLRLELPPLRDRGSDILVLAREFLRGSAEKMGRRLALTEAAEQRLLQAPWPGNVRQLQNEMQRVAALSDGPDVRVEELTV
ncbi:MAG: sigma-54 interaction domain-containing protein [Planctomycetota bacterium]